MQIKTQLICDDVRVEVGGTFSAIGIYNEQLVVDATSRILLPRLAFVFVVSGLQGVGKISCRHQVTRVGDANEPPPSPMEQHEHVAERDEHNFVYVRSPMEVGEPGSFLSVFEGQTDAGTVVSRYVFRIGGPPQVQ